MTRRREQPLAPQRLAATGTGPLRGLSPSRARLRLLVLLGLMLVTLAAYQPAWNGGVLWDDEGHLTRSDLAMVSGLGRIWFEPGATQQYYPVVHTAFWILNKLWGHHTTGYHVVNLLLHATSAWLLWLLLARLSIPGALLAGVVFALHPVHVESVAWITELKNVLSGTFYLAALHAWLKWEEDRGPRRYAIAFALFALAVLSKTVTVTLPAAILVIAWWRRGRIDFENDVRPLVPFLAVGLVAGLTTVWVERTFIGAQGSEFELTLVERLLLAGTVPWFYAWKLVWPADLVFIYPRWTISAGTAVWWAPVLALSLVATVAWMFRSRSRAPLTVILLFVGTLFPALGFFNVYPFRFSFVADHFQYLASIALIAGAAALLGRRRQVELSLAAVLGIVLGTVTWQHAHAYTDAATLYRTTISRNPSAWIAHNNLASLLLAGDPTPARIEEAMTHLQRALALKPDYAEAHYNLGTAFERLARRQEAAAAYTRALELAPGERRTLQRLAAVSHDRASALLEEGLGHEDAGRLEEAAQAYTAAAALDPSRSVIHRSLGRVYQKAGRRGEAIGAYQRALQADPKSFEAHNDLGVLFAQLGRVADALPHFRAAVSLRPDDAAARANLDQALQLLGQSKR